MEYDLLSPSVFESMKDIEWFNKSISCAYRAIARRYGCTILMSETRLIQSHDVFWEDADNGRTRHLPAGTTQLDQFKMSAYLCFWLRRINPIRDVGPFYSLDGRAEWVAGSERQPTNVENFVLYGNEVCALTIAIQLSQYLSLISAPSNDPKIELINQKRMINSFNHEMTIEFAKILKHKNVSSHGIYMALLMFNKIGTTIIQY